MTYDTSGIQQEGGQGYFGQEESVWTVEPRKGKRGPQGIKREPINCPCCGKSFVIKPGASLKTRFCSIKCGSNNRPKDIIANEKRKCMTCHALVGMTGAASGRMVNLPKGVICVFRNKNKLPVFSRSQAGIIAGVRARGGYLPPPPWWGDKTAETGWMSQIKVKDFDWSSVWTNEKNNRTAFDLYNSAELIYERSCYRDILLHRFKTIHPDWSSVWTKSRMSMTKEARVIDNLRKRFRGLMKRTRNNDSFSRSNMVGCSSTDLKRHLESKFKRGMTWDNYGDYWHVDHIIPCAAFDQSITSQRAQCWHWTNLRPLEAAKNMAKSDTITEPQMSLLLCAG